MAAQEVCGQGAMHSPVASLQLGSKPEQGQIGQGGRHNPASGSQTGVAGSMQSAVTAQAEKQIPVRVSQLGSVGSQSLVEVQPATQAHSEHTSPRPHCALEVQSQGSGLAGQPTDAARPRIPRQKTTPSAIRLIPTA